MRTVEELTESEIEDLRVQYFYELQDQGEGIQSEAEIPVSNVISRYEGIHFVEEDFFCNI